MALYLVLNLDERLQPQGLLSLETNLGSIVPVFTTSQAAQRFLASPFVQKLIQQGDGPKGVMEDPARSFKELLLRMRMTDRSMENVAFLLDTDPAWAQLWEQVGGVLPAHLLAIWDPILSALAAARFDAEARVSLDQALSVQETHPDWKSVVSDIRSILNETGAPPSGVDEIDTALRERAQAAWAGRSEIRPNLWRAIKLRELLANVVRGAMGDGAGRERAIASIDEPSLSVLPLSARLRRILEGERDRDALVHGLDATAADVVDTLLDYLA